jgi:tetratricopeptide (TPR) repeat protein
MKDLRTNRSAAVISLHRLARTWSALRWHALKALIAWAALPLALGLCTRAHAEHAPELEQNAAAHFEKGVELYREGSLDAALVEFERAYELIPSYRLLYNLAQIQAERHEYTTAVSLFEKYLAAGGDQISEARRNEARAEIEKLGTRISYLSVESNVEGAQLFVDDVQVGRLPLAAPVPVNSGVCEVRLEKPGYLPTRQRLKVAGGERPRLNLTLVANDGTRAAGAAASSANYLPFWISSAATLACAGATLGLGLTANAADRDLDAALHRFPAQEGALDDARSQLKLYAALTDAFAAASVVGLGVALYFLIDPPLSARAPEGALRQSRAGARREPARSVRISPSQRGVGLRATF